MFSAAQIPSCPLNKQREMCQSCRPWLCNTGVCVHTVQSPEEGTVTQKATGMSVMVRLVQSFSWLSACFLICLFCCKQNYLAKQQVPQMNSRSLSDRRIVGHCCQGQVCPALNAWRTETPAVVLLSATSELGHRCNQEPFAKLYGALGCGAVF